MNMLVTFGKKKEFSAKMAESFYIFIRARNTIKGKIQLGVESDKKAHCFHTLGNLRNSDILEMCGMKNF